MPWLLTQRLEVVEPSTGANSPHRLKTASLPAFSYRNFHPQFQSSVKHREGFDRLDRHLRDGTSKDDIFTTTAHPKEQARRTWCEDMTPSKSPTLPIANCSIMEDTNTSTEETQYFQNYVQQSLIQLSDGDRSRSLHAHLSTWSNKKNSTCKLLFPLLAPWCQHLD